MCSFSFSEFLGSVSGVKNEKKKLAVDPLLYKQMNSSDSSGASGSNRHADHLGLNTQSHKIGKNVRKSPIHQSNFGNSRPQQPQPQVYNIKKRDFRSIVQQLTGSPAAERLAPSPPPVHPSKPPNMRLQKIRPPPLTPPINRPQSVPQPIAPPTSFNDTLRYNAPNSAATMSNNNNNMNYNTTFMARPNNQNFLPSPTFSPLPPLTPGDAIWANAAESPISAYVRYLQNSVMDPSSRPSQQQQLLPGLLPTPPLMLQSPQGNPPPLLPSPTSQFLLPSPNAFIPLSSPRSPFPLLSPGSFFPSPGINPHFSFHSPSQSGILGPGPQLPPPSPGFFLPPSPVGRFPISSPRWREQ